jgi:hypothetical protein
VNGTDEAIGHWVQVVLGADTLYTGGRQVEFGVLRDADEGFLYVERADGETVCLPQPAVRDVRIIEAPELGPGGTLLRPAERPDAELLLRPAGPGQRGP